MTLVDTNVLFDVAADDSVWFQWSSSRLRNAALDGPLIINPVVFAELSVQFEAVAEVEALLATLGVEMDHIPHSALFLAGKAFSKYRRSGGSRTGVLPDFFIGAHAATTGLPLLTRDPRRYRSYFPDVRLITPDLN